MLANFALDTTRIAVRHTVCGNRTSNNTSCAYNGVVANANAGQNYSACANPNVIADLDGQRILSTDFAIIWSYGVTCGRNYDVGRKHNVVADIDTAIVY